MYVCLSMYACAYGNDLLSAESTLAS